MISKTQKIHVAIYYVKVYSNQLSKNNIIHTHKLLKAEKIEVQSICNWYFRKPAITWFPFDYCTINSCTIYSYVTCVLSMFI